MLSPRQPDHLRADSVDPDDYRDANDTVDPYLRAHVHSLVAALGGPSPEKNGGYVLGDEAQYVLRDLKKWLRAYDEKLNRLDVARCLAESKLVGNDLVEILASWPEDKIEDRRWYRLALSCLELLVPLTWPLERREEMTVNHHRHITYLEYAQAGYKRVILHHRSRKVLRNCVKIALPSLVLPINKRESRDESIIRLVLYFLRNITAIRHPNPTDGDTGEDIGRNATIKAFVRDNVLHLLLTIASGMGEDFKVQDVPVMEILFHLLKGVNMKELFMSDAQIENKEKENLASLLALEKGMETIRNRDGPTRHNRFGTQLWVSRGNGKPMSTVSGQDALASKEKGLQKMDGYKRWNKPKGSRRQLPDDVYVPVQLSTSGKKILREFVEDFIDAGFNPLFQHIRKDIMREEDRFVSSIIKVFFYLVAWFLEAERMRREAALRNNPKEIAGSFSIIASVMNQETLILIQKFMKQWWDLKMWSELETVMKCFTQILLTVQDMAASPFEEDQEIAENIQSRIFYEESTLDLVHTILRAYTTQTFNYLNIITELVHVHTKMLERYSKQNTQIFVRAKKARSSKKKDTENKNDDSDPDIQRENSTVLKEKAFDFKRFEARLLNSSCVDSFVTFMGYYKELDYSQIKRALSYFHRVFVKRKTEIALYRLDIIELFYRMMQDKEGLPPTHPAYRELDQFTRYLIKCLVRKLQTTPTLYVELLFSKIPRTAYYLMHGVDQEPEVKAARAAAIFHVKGSMTHAEQIGVTIAALVDEGHKDVVLWIKDVLESAAKERRLWETEREARKLLEATEKPAIANNDAAVDLTKDSELPPIIPIQFGTEERKKLLFKDAKLRLLCTLVGAEIQGERDDVNSAWILPSHIPASTLEEYIQIFQKYLEHRIQLPDGQTPADLIKRKPAPRKTAYLSSDSEEGSEDKDFVVGDAVSDVRMKTQRSGRRRGKGLRDEEGLQDGKGKGRERIRREPNEIEQAINEKLAEERRLLRLKENVERAAQIKSSMYINDSDEEWVEEEIRKMVERNHVLREKMSMMEDKDPEVQEAITDIYSVDDMPTAVSELRKVTTPPTNDESEDEDAYAMDVDDDDETHKEKAVPKRKRTTRHISSDENEIFSDRDMADAEDSDEESSPKEGKEKSTVRTTLGSKHTKSRKRQTPTPTNDDEDEEMEDVSPPKKRLRPSFGRMVRLDSDGDEDEKGHEDQGMVISQKVSSPTALTTDDEDIVGMAMSSRAARSRAVARLLSDDEDE